LAGREPYEITLEDRQNALLDYFTMLREDMPELPALGKMKQLAGQFTKGMIGGSHFRQALYHSHSVQEILAHIADYFTCIQEGRSYGSGQAEAAPAPELDSCEAACPPAEESCETALAA
jgi:hypothetical protein